MPLRRRYTAPFGGNLCSPGQAGMGRGTWAYNNYCYNRKLRRYQKLLSSSDHLLYMILLPPDGPLPHAQSPPFPQPHSGPSAPQRSLSQGAIISPEDDIQRLFNVCKVGRGNAELLNEVLVYAKPQELKNDITKVAWSSIYLLFRSRGRPTDVGIARTSASLS